MPVARLSLLLVLMLGCAGRARVKRTDPATVSQVQIEGNRQVSSSTLLDGLALTEARERGEPLEPYLINVDADRVRGYYVRQGYFAVDVRPKLTEKGGRAAVTFAVVEGPRATLTRVEVIGLPEDPQITPDRVRALVDMADGAPFDYKRYEDARPRVLAALDRVGYARATMKASVIADRVRDEAIIRFEIEPGPKCRFGEITIVGVEGRLADATRARLAFAPGDPFSSGKMEEAQAALYDMGRFTMVRLEADRAGDAGVIEIPVTVEVTEADRNELRLGGGFGIDPAAYQVHGRTAYTITGWPKPLITTEVELRPAYTLLRDDYSQEPRLEARTSLERLDLFHPRIRGLAEASFTYRAVEAYTSVGPRLRLGVRIPSIRNVLHVDAGWEMSRLAFRRLDPALDEMTIRDLRLDRSDLVGFYVQRIALELRDNPVDPTRGGYFQLDLEEGGPWAASELTFLRIGPDARGYLPLGPMVLASRVRFGMFAGDIPVTERFYAGGANSHRGFPMRRLSPTVTSEVDGMSRSVVIGGGASLELGAELRAPLGKVKGVKLGGVVFLDGGDVTERVGEIDLGYLHWAAGAGLRFGTPIGPVQLDLGYRLNRTGMDEPSPGRRFAYHLSLGESF